VRAGPAGRTLARSIAIIGTSIKRSSLIGHERTGGSNMLRGGLLWLIGIPLPIILILFFLGYLS
jgi:hypothetical protein